MLSRYKMYRGKRPESDPLQNGIRYDTRKHTSHCLRPTIIIVEEFLADPTDKAWNKFRVNYLAVIRKRFAEDPIPFEHIEKLANEQDVYLGCSCPTTKNPNVLHCHTVLALEFMQATFPQLEVIHP